MEAERHKKYRVIVFVSNDILQALTELTMQNKIYSRPFEASDKNKDRN